VGGGGLSRELASAVKQAPDKAMLDVAQQECGPAGVCIVDHRWLKNY